VLISEWQHQCCNCKIIAIPSTSCNNGILISPCLYHKNKLYLILCSVILCIQTWNTHVCTYFLWKTKLLFTFQFTAFFTCALVSCYKISENFFRSITSRLKRINFMMSCIWFYTACSLVLSFYDWQWWQSLCSICMMWYSFHFNKQLLGFRICKKCTGVFQHALHFSGLVVTVLLNNKKWGT
jgi:hypothetical protein